MSLKGLYRIFTRHLYHLTVSEKAIFISINLISVDLCSFKQWLKREIEVLREFFIINIFRILWRMMFQILFEEKLFILLTFISIYLKRISSNSLSPFVKMLQGFKQTFSMPSSKNAFSEHTKSVSKTQHFRFLFQLTLILLLSFLLSNFMVIPYSND